MWLLIMMMMMVMSFTRAAWSVDTRPEKPSVDWILERIKNINEAEVEAIEERQKAAALIDSAVRTAASQSDFKHLTSSDLKEAKNLLMESVSVLMAKYLLIEFVLVMEKGKYNLSILPVFALELKNSWGIPVHTD